MPIISSIKVNEHNYRESNSVLPPQLDQLLTLLFSERPKLCTILVFLSAIGLKDRISLGANSFLEE